MFFILFCIPIIVNSLTFFRLSTLGQSQLKVNQYVSSTLGYFKFSLVPHSCQLKIQQFSSSNNQNTYRVVGYYPSQPIKSCQSLQLNFSGLSTSNNQSFLSLAILTSAQVQQTFITIDDSGTIRLQSIFQNQSSIQTKITMFRFPQKFIVSTNYQPNLAWTLSLVQNFGGWGFTAVKGRFNIFFIRNKTLQAKFQFPNIIIGTNVFKQDNVYTVPLVNLNGLNYQARCGQPKSVKFRSPFVFILNQYWPELRILDQEGYQIFTARYPSINCINNIGIQVINNQKDCISWFCPPETFQLNGNCLATCPSPYFHQIDRNSKNRCVLMCQSGTIMDNLTQFCSCQIQQKLICPFNLVSTPFGCLCRNNTFFSSVNTFSKIQNLTLKEICLIKCPSRFYDHNSGICVSCPLFCLKCQLTNNSVTYLQCTQCEDNFQVFSTYCKKKCDQFIGNYIANSTETQFYCKKCTISNCTQCKASQAGEICLKCFIPYSLYNNKCIIQCPRNDTLIVFKDSSYFECQQIKKCSSIQKISNSDQKFQCLNDCSVDLCFENCNLNIIVNNHSQCFCQQDTNNFSFISTLLINSQYQPLITYQNFLQNNNCSITLFYYNYKTNECLACPFSCLTCIINLLGYPQCTSCMQNYYLILIYEYNYCQKQTSLVNSFDYSTQYKYGFLIQNVVNSETLHKSCLQKNPFCMICLMNNTQYCTLCKNGYYLHLGRCQASCPSGFYYYKYQPICLPFMIDNCQIQSISSIHYYLNIDSNTQYMEGYRYFTSVFFSMIHNQNDPIGLIYVIYGFLKKKILETRTTIFNSGQSTCKVCNDGYGLTPQGQCGKCNDDCLLCLYQNSKFCIRCHPYYSINQNNLCIPLPDNQKPCIQGQFRNQSGFCQNGCNKFRIITQKQLIPLQNQKVINCTSNCPSSMRIYVMNNNNLMCLDNKLSIDDLNKVNLLQNGSSMSIKQINSDPIKLMSSCYNMNVQMLCIIQPTVPIPSLQSQKISINQLRPVGMSQSSKPSSQSLILSPTSIFMLVPSATIVSLQVSKFFNPSTQQYLGNSVYILTNNNMLDSILNMDKGMHLYGRMFVVLFLVIAVVGFANMVDYKLEQVFILINTLYLLLLGLNLNINTGAYPFYGWLYGFGWSLGLQLFSNPRDITPNSAFFGQNYVQNTQNNSHLLLFIDDNFIRNSWSIIILILIISGVYLLSQLVTKLLTHTPNQLSQLKSLPSKISTQLKACIQVQQRYQPKLFSFNLYPNYESVDIIHLEKIRIFCFFIIQNMLMGLVYYSLRQMDSQEWVLAKGQSLRRHKVLAVAAFIIAITYVAIRAYVHFIAAIYLAKRILITFAFFIFPPYQAAINLSLALIFIQIIFILARIYLQCLKDVLELIEFLNQKLNKNNKSQSSFIKQAESDQKMFKSQKDQQIEDAFYVQKGTFGKDFERQNNKISKSIYQKLKEFYFTHEQLSYILLEQFLIILVYISISFNQNYPQLFILITFLILTIFLIIFIDDLIFDLIEQYQINFKLKHNKDNQQKFYFSIRNNFDFQTQINSNIQSHNKNSPV